MSKFYKMIEALSKEVKAHSIYPVIANRLFDGFDEEVDYRRKKPLCPFHDDRHAGNFNIKEQSFNCYSCGTSGDAVTFVMEYDGVGFIDAVLICAKEMEIITEEEFNQINKRTITEITPSKKTNIVIKDRNEIADAVTLDKIYRLFSKGMTYLKKPLLSDEHMQHLMEVRNLSESQIKEQGYFTFPSIYILKHMLKEMKKLGIPENTLHHVPGFFFDKKKEKLSFATLKNNSGIGIPIRNAEGLIIGIQIRMDTEGKNGLRYQWFSSAFKNADYCLHGTSPGAPVDVIFPHQIKTNKIYITEGHFKAMQLANKYSAISFSVQGVHNWRSIPHLLDVLKARYPYLKEVIIAYDADMSFKESVLQPGIKLGLSITGLPFTEVKSSVDEILAINKRYKKPLSELTSEFQATCDYLNDNIGSFKFDVSYCLWDEDLGKGIDDYLENGHEDFYYMQLIDFWKHSYYYLLENEKSRNKVALREGLEEHEVHLSEYTKKENFFEIFHELEEEISIL